MAIVEAIATAYLEEGVEPNDTFGVEFTGIPATYENLRLIVSPRSPNNTDAGHLHIQFGTGGGAVDTGANYDSHYQGVSGTTILGGSLLNSGKIILYDVVTGRKALAERFGAVEILISDYANTNKNTTTMGWCGLRTTSASKRNMQYGGCWDNTAAVDRIKIIPNTDGYARGTSYTLYGEKSS
jgi:hypothetical protein